MRTKWYTCLFSPDATEGALKSTKREAIATVDEALEAGRYTRGTVVRYRRGYTDLVYEAKVEWLGKIRRSNYRTSQVA